MSRDASIYWIELSPIARYPQPIIDQSRLPSTVLPITTLHREQHIFNLPRSHLPLCSSHPFSNPQLPANLTLPPKTHLHID